MWMRMDVSLFRGAFNNKSLLYGVNLCIAFLWLHALLMVSLVEVLLWARRQVFSRCAFYHLCENCCLHKSQFLQRRYWHSLGSYTTADDKELLYNGIRMRLGSWSRAEETVEAFWGYLKTSPMFTKATVFILNGPISHSQISNPQINCLLKVGSWGSLCKSISILGWSAVLHV